MFTNNVYLVFDGIVKIVDDVSMPRLSNDQLHKMRRENIGRLVSDAGMDFQARALTRMQSELDPRLRETHLVVLKHLSMTGDRLTELAEKAVVSKQALGPLVDAVEALGYVERVEDPADGRAKRIQFTKEGRDLLRKTVGFFVEIEESYAQAIGVTKLEELRATLKELLCAVRATSSI